MTQDSHPTDRTYKAQIKMLMLPEDNWAEKVSALKREGIRVANRMRSQGDSLVVEILGPQEIHGQDPVPLRAVVLGLDWKVATRLEMVESARELIDKAYVLESLDPGLPTVLASIIEGKGLYEHSIGEFFLLYGRFEGEYGLKRQSQVSAKMEALLARDKTFMRSYVDTRAGTSSLVPLPLAVRNILTHPDPRNQLDAEGKELKTSIDLLKSWVSTR